MIVLRSVEMGIIVRSLSAGNGTVIGVDGDTTGLGNATIIMPDGTSGLNSSYTTNVVQLVFSAMSVKLKSWVTQPDGSGVASMSMTPSSDRAGLPSETILGQLETGRLAQDLGLSLSLTAVSRQPGECL